jgi:hypothetical protein
MAISATYLGLRGSGFAVRAAHDKWSKMRTLGSSSLRVSDSWDIGVGADVLGPRLLGAPLQLRSGMRWRTLPFGIAGSTGDTGDVKERSYSIGAGRMLARGRANVDVAGIRADRTTSASAASEASWTLSVGITVRP